MAAVLIGFIVNLRKLEHGIGGLVLGSLIHYLKGMRIMMFQLSGFYVGFREQNSGFRRARSRGPIEHNVGT